MMCKKLIVLALVLGLMASMGQAAVLEITPDAPVPGDLDIANLVGSVSDVDNIAGEEGAVYNNDFATYIAHDRGGQGQTFVTGDSDVVITGVWVQHVGYTTEADTTWYRMQPEAQLQIRVTDPAASGTDEFVLASEIYEITGEEDNALPADTTNDATGTGLWVHLILDTPVALAANTEYGFDITSLNLGGPVMFFETMGIKDDADGGNPYADGASYVSGASGQADNVLTPTAGDRVFVVELEAAGAEMPKIVYVDAAGATDPNVPANTFLATGEDFLPVDVGSGGSGVDGLWRIRYNFSNGGTIIESRGDWGADNSEDCPRLMTSVDVPEGNYNVYAYMWTGGGENYAAWRLGASLTDDVNELPVYLCGDPDGEAVLAVAEDFAEPVPIVTEDDRTMWQIPLGTTGVTTAITVYVDDDVLAPSDESSGGNARTWYDGIGYEVVPPTIVYVDATDGEAGNTMLATGEIFTAVDVPTGGSGADGLWRVRAFANSGTIFEAGGSWEGSGNTEDCPRLMTSVDVPEGKYDVYAYIWADGDQWRVQASLENIEGDLPLYLTNDPNGEATVAVAGDFIEPVPMLTEDNRTLWQVYLGTTGTTTVIDVFIDDDPNHLYGAARTWYDGIGYGAVPPVKPIDPGTDNLVAYYPLDGDVLDYSGNGLDGTIMGDPVFTEGIVGMGLQLDGVDDYVDCGNNPLFDFTEQITLATWVNVNDFGNGQNDPWINKGDHGWCIKGHRTGEAIEFFVYEGGWNWISAEVGAINNEWHHAAGTFDGTQLKIYLDGAEISTKDYVGGIATAEHNVALGTNTEASGRFSEGVLDEARIYDRALSEAEILYISGL